MLTLRRIHSVQLLPVRLLSARYLWLLSRGVKFDAYSRPSQLRAFATGLTPGASANIALSLVLPYALVIEYLRRMETLCP